MGFRAVPTCLPLPCNIQGFFIYIMRELKLSAHHRAEVELCYKKERGECRLYDDTIQPRVLIANISGCDLDGWQWHAECPKMADVWQQQTYFITWRAALVTAALAYINGY